MKRMLLAFALLAPVAALARPLLIAPQRLQMPTPPPPYPSSLEFMPEYGSVAIDGDTVTGGTRYLMLHDGMENFFNSGALERGTGTWIQVVIDDEQDSFHSYRRQTDTAGDARAFSRTPLGDQVVIARMQPLSYGPQTGNAWFGIAARVVDDQNYLYMSLRRSREMSLRRVVNGTVQVIATVPVPVNLNQWYDLRLEAFGSGVLTYRTSADLWTWITYQP